CSADRLRPAGRSPLMRQLILIVAACLIGSFGRRAPAAIKNDGEGWWAHVKVLADDSMEGRNTGSPGHKRAAEYVAAQFKKAGLEPAGTNGYIQTVKFKTRKIDEAHSSLALERDGKTEPLTLGEDANLSVRIDPAPSVNAPLLYVGYGLKTPERK